MLSPSHYTRQNLSESYAGTLTSLDDPQRLGRVQVEILGLTDGLDPALLPWATIQTPLGNGINRGMTPVLQIGDQVEVLFQQGDSRYPVVVSSRASATEGELEMPAIAVAGPRSNAGLRSTPAEVPTSQGLHLSYMSDEVSLQHAIQIQRRANQSYRIAHLSQGSQFEMTSSGEVTLFSPQALWMASTSALEVRYQQAHEVGGHHQSELSGDYSLSCSHAHLTSIASTQLDAGGKLGLSGLSVNLVSIDGISALSAGATSLTAGTTIDLSSTLGISLSSATGGITGSALLGNVVLSSAEVNRLELTPAGGFTLKSVTTKVSGSVEGTIKVENPVASLRLDTTGEVELKNATAGLTMGTSGAVELKNTLARLELSTAGRATLGNQADTLGRVLQDLLTAIQAITVSTGTGRSSQPLNVTELQTISRRLNQLLE